MSCSTHAYLYRTQRWKRIANDRTRFALLKANGIGRDAGEPPNEPFRLALRLNTNFGAKSDGKSLLSPEYSSRSGKQAEGKPKHPQNSTNHIGRLD